MRAARETRYTRRSARATPAAHRFVRRVTQASDTAADVPVRGAPGAVAGVYAPEGRDDQLDERDQMDRSQVAYPSSRRPLERGGVNELGAILHIPLIQLVIPLTS